MNIRDAILYKTKSVDSTWLSNHLVLEYALPQAILFCSISALLLLHEINDVTLCTTFMCIHPSTSYTQDHFYALPLLPINYFVMYEPHRNILETLNKIYFGTIYELNSC